MMSKALRRFSCGFAGQRVAIETHLDLGRVYARLARDHFPPLYELYELEEGPRLSTDALLHHDDRPGTVTVRWEEESDTMVVSCPDESVGDGEPLLHLATMLLERRLQLNGYASLVAACVALDGAGALLLGSPGAGKTSAALALCLRFDGRLVANDTCVVHLVDNAVWSVGGSRTVGLRYHAVLRNEPRLLSRLDKPAWRGKLAVAPPDLGLVVAESPVVLAGVYLVHVDDRRRRADAVSALAVATRTQLYENLSRLLRGACWPCLTLRVADFRPYVPSFDCERAFERRLALIDALVDGLGVTSVSGPVGAVAQWINADVARRVSASAHDS